MPRGDQDSFFEMLRDILREVSPIVGGMLLLGLGGGVGLSFYLISEMSPVELQAARLVAALMVVGLLFAGATVGLALGSLLDYLWNRLRGADDAKKRRKKRRP